MFELFYFNLWMKQTIWKDSLMELGYKVHVQKPYTEKAK